MVFVSRQNLHRQRLAPRWNDKITNLSSIDVKAVVILRNLQQLGIVNVVVRIALT